MIQSWGNTFTHPDSGLVGRYGSLCFATLDPGPVELTVLRDEKIKYNVKKVVENMRFLLCICGEGFKQSFNKVTGD
jgi:hypothetical protein